jgi:hypothetical protein
MEAVSINVELDKGILYLEHSTKLSDKGGRVVNATWSDSLKCSIAHVWKEKDAWETEKFSSFHLSWYHSYYPVNASFIISRASLIHKSRDKIYLRGEG